MPSRTIINMGKDNSNTRKRDFDRRARKTYNIDSINDELKQISNYAGIYIY